MEKVNKKLTNKIPKTLLAKLGGFFNMYTDEQIKTLKEYKAILKDYNEGKISYKEYVDQTLPLWDKLNVLFEKDQKSV